MSDFQDWCKKILPIVKAAADGEVIQGRFNGAQTWVDSSVDWECFVASHEYRVKPRTIKIGDFDVPEPMREAPNGGVEVFSPMPASQEMYWSWPWWGSKADFLALNRGVVHCNMDSAVAHSIAIISLTEPK